MRIAFFGLPLAALLLARDGHDIVYAGICRKQAPGTRRLAKTIGADRVEVKPSMSGSALRERLHSLDIDLLVSWFWTTKIPKPIVATAQLGGFGVHPSLLPRWRGPDPYFWAIDANDAVTGVTAHRIAEGYDTGAMLGQRALPIAPEWDAWKLARALDRPSLELLRATCAAFARGEPPVGVAQDESLVTLAPTPDDELLAIDWKMSADAIVRRVRAAAPYPGAWTFIGDEAVIVSSARRTNVPRALTAGEATVIDGIACVAAGDFAVALLAGRSVDDDSEEPLDATAIAMMVRRAEGDGLLPRT